MALRISRIYVVVRKARHISFLAQNKVFIDFCRRKWQFGQLRGARISTCPKSRHSFVRASRPRRWKRSRSLLICIHCFSRRLYRMTRQKFFAAVVTFLFLSFSIIAIGQELAATLTGRATDPSGAAIPGATVVVA